MTGMLGQPELFVEIDGEMRSLPMIEEVRHKDRYLRFRVRGWKDDCAIWHKFAQAYETGEALNFRFGYRDNTWHQPISFPAHVFEFERKPTIVSSCKLERSNVFTIRMQGETK